MSKRQPDEQPCQLCSKQPWLLNLSCRRYALMTSAGFGKIAQYPVIEYAESDRFALLQCYNEGGLQMRWIAIAVIRFAIHGPSCSPNFSKLAFINLLHLNEPPEYLVRPSSQQCGDCFFNIQLVIAALRLVDDCCTSSMRTYSFPIAGFKASYVA